MKNLFKLFSVLMLLAIASSQASAQIKDGEATVIQGSTTTVSIGSAYQTTLNRATGISYTWTTGNSAISIQSKTNKTCTIKGNTLGTAKLNYHCSYYIDGYYRTMDFYYDITIKSNTILISRIEMTPSSATLEIGETLQLNATPYPTNATNRNLNWSTEDYDVASVSNNGLVTARGEGRVWIWARAKDGSGAGNYCVIDVKEAAKVASIELSETKKTLTVGENFELTATILPVNAYNKSLVWTSDNEEIATVSNGMITAINPGECNIKCLSSDGSDVSAICHIIVQEPEQHWLSVIVPDGNFAIDVTDMAYVRLKITPDEGYTINSITLDGYGLEHNNGDIVLPGLTHSSTLNVVFGSEPIAGISTVDGDNGCVKVAVSNHTVSVKGLNEGEQIYAYDINGTLLRIISDNIFDLPKSGIYILHIDDMSYKLAIK